MCTWTRKLVFHRNIQIKSEYSNQKELNEEELKALLENSEQSQLQGLSEHLDTKIKQIDLFREPLFAHSLPFGPGNLKQLSHDSIL